MTSFIPLSNIKLLQDQQINLQEIGQSSGFLGLGKKVYLAYDKNTHQWGVESLNLGERILRSVLGWYQETHHSKVESALLTSPEILLGIPEVENRVSHIWHRNLGQLNPKNLADEAKFNNYLHAIKLDSDSTEAYLKIGDLLSPHHKVYFSNGSQWGKKDFYLKAIELSPNDGQLYGRLANILLDEESIELPDGTKKTRQELYLKNILLSPQDASAYLKLGIILRPDASITIDGTPMTRQDLFLIAIHLNPNDWNGYDKLEETLDKDEMIQLIDGTKMSKEDLVEKAFKLDWRI